MEIKLLGPVNREHLEERIRIVAASARLSRLEGNVFDALEKSSDFEKNIKYIRRVIEMGHESITDHDYLVFALCDVSPIVEQVLIDERLSSFTIKSRREVNFQNAGFYTPPFRDHNYQLLPDQTRLTEEYQNYMKGVFDNYQKLVEWPIPKEDARFVLPYSYHSNIIMGVDAHVLKNIIVKLTKGPKRSITELRLVGEKLYDIVRTQVPYFADIIEKEEQREDPVRSLLDPIVQETAYEIVDRPQLLSQTSDIDKVIFTTALMYKYQLSHRQAEEVYQDKIRGNDELCRRLIKSIYEGDQKELTQVNFRFQIPISLAVLTHLSRHRMHEIVVSDFVPVHNLKLYKTPPTVTPRLQSFYDQIFTENEKMYQKFCAEGVCPEDLIYFHLSGHLINIETNINGKYFAWMSRLRACNKTQWETRQIFQEMIQEVGEECTYYKTILGPDCETRGLCKEGRESCGKIKALKRGIL